MIVEHDVSFKSLTTFKVGSTASKVIHAETEEEFITTFREGGDVMVLGGGSNTLALDSDYAGTVLVPAFKKISFDDRGEYVLVTVDAGVSWDELVAGAVERGIWGVENLSGIPGTVGGAVFQNIGAYGSVLSDTVESVRAFSLKRGEISELSRGACHFGYRTSLFKKEAGEWAILSAKLKLTKAPSPNLSYQDVVRLVDGTSDIATIRDAVINIRAKKFPPLDTYGTAGSFFLNPIVSEEEAASFTRRFPDMPLFALPEGGIKIPLAWILDRVVDATQMRVGGAFVWPHQALVIATEAGATSRDVHMLQKQLQEKVFEKTGLMIVPEVRVMNE